MIAFYTTTKEVIMSNTRKNKIVITGNGKPGSRLAYFELIHLLFFSFLVALSPLSVSAAEPTNIAPKTDSGYYEGNYGKGAYWVTPGLYSSIFNIHGKKITDKQKKYFIYSRGHLGEARLYQTHRKAAPVKNKHINPELRLPRKIHLKISRTM